MTKIASSFNYSWLSKYRDVLMGVAILGVMITHLFDWNETNKIIVYLFKPLTGTVFTEGFLLLSGFGLYYSLRKNSDIVSFYVRRLFRLVIPFCIIATPFYIWQCVTFDKPLYIFFEKILAIYYWFYGNDGMWYISVSIFLYIFFPVLYLFLFKHNKFIKFKSIALVFVFYGTTIIMYSFYPDYFKLIKEGLSQMPMFVIGIIFGHLAYNSLHIKGEVIYIALLGVIAFITNLETEGIVGILGTGFLRLFCTLVLCMVLSRLEDKVSFQPFFNVIKLILKWFGRYTLELYVLHIFLWNILSYYWANPLVASVLSVLFSICLAAPIHKTIDGLMRNTNTHTNEYQ